MYWDTTPIKMIEYRVINVYLQEYFGGKTKKILRNSSIYFTSLREFLYLKIEAILISKDA
jgi:hypothetical protein